MRAVLSGDGFTTVILSGGHHEAGFVIVGKPIAYNPLNDAKVERLRMASVLEGTIKAMYLEVTENEAVQAMFFRRKISLFSNCLKSEAFIDLLPIGAGRWDNPLG